MARFEGTKIRELRGHRTAALAVGWSCDGRRLASSSSDHTVRVFPHIERHSRGGESYELKGHTDSVDQLCWDPTHPERLATASVDKTVRIWDTRAAKATHTIQTGGENINLAFSPDGRSLAVGNRGAASQDDIVVVIETRSYQIERTQHFKFEVNEIDFNRSGTSLFVTTGKGSVAVLDFPSLEHRHTLQAHTSNCYCIDFDPKGRYFATGGADALVALWDLDEFVPVRTFRKLEWPVRTVSFTYDGAYLAMGSEDSVIDISSVSTGESVFQVPCRAVTTNIAWHPSRYLLAYASEVPEDRSARDADICVRLFGLTD